MNPNTGPTPNLGAIFLNFETLTPFSTFNSYTQDGVTISSDDGLLVDPFSTQNPLPNPNPLNLAPNELLDNGAEGMADITIETAFGSSAIGLGISDSDDDPITGNPITIDLQPFGSGGPTDPLGSAFDVTIPPDSLGNSDGYFVIQDSTPELYGLEIIQPTAVGSLYSGLAITDVQVAPEPASLPVMGGALLAMAGLVWRRRKSA